MTDRRLHPEPLLDNVVVEGPPEFEPVYSFLMDLPVTYPVCSRCGSFDVEEFSFPSFGGTVEYVERCLSCGASVTDVDLSAIM